MFDLNFIAEPGIQTGTSEANWSFLHKRKEPETAGTTKPSVDKPIKSGTNWKYYGIASCSIIILAVIGIFTNPQPKLGPDMVLNQVIDLIIESGYMNNLKLVEAHFKHDHVKVTITSHKLSSLQNFTRGYHKEDNIPYEIFQKNKLNYVSLNFPWEGHKKGGNIETLKKLSEKTVFSNKISIRFTDNEFGLQGRSSDIISYLLQLADKQLIQKFILSVHHLESGRFYLKVQGNNI